MADILVELIDMEKRLDKMKAECWLFDPKSIERLRELYGEANDDFQND
jgi:hypothetical protein